MNNPEAATKEKKPWYRFRNIALGVVVAVVVTIGWVAWETISLMNAEPNVAVDYRAEMVEHLRSSVPYVITDDEEVWLTFVASLEAVDAIVRVHEERLVDASPEALTWREDEYLQFGYIRSVPPMSPEAIAPELAALKALRDERAFAGVGEAVSGPVPVRIGALRNMFTATGGAELRHSRLFAYARVASMYLAARDGELTEAVDALDEMLGVAQIVASQEQLIDYLVGNSIVMITILELMPDLHEVDFDHDSARRILEVLQRRRLPSIASTMVSEELAFLDVMQRICSDDGDGAGYLIPGELIKLSSPPNSPEPSLIQGFEARFRFPSRREQIAEYKHIVGAALAQVDLALADQDWSWLVHESNTASDGNLATVLALPSVGAVESDAIARSFYNGAIILAALEVYEATNDRLPESLEVLTRDILESLPVDPINGLGYGYRVLEQPDEHGREFILYSFGFDKIDDGGAEYDWKSQPRWDPYRPLKEALPGADFIINQPRGWLDRDRAE